MAPAGDAAAEAAKRAAATAADEGSAMKGEDSWLQPARPPPRPPSGRPPPPRTSPPGREGIFSTSPLSVFPAGRKTLLLVKVAHGLQAVPSPGAAPDQGRRYPRGFRWRPPRPLRFFQRGVVVSTPSWESHPLAKVSATFPAARMAWQANMSATFPAGGATPRVEWQAKPSATLV